MFFGAGITKGSKVRMIIIGISNLSAFVFWSWTDCNFLCPLKNQINFNFVVTTQLTTIFLVYFSHIHFTSIFSFVKCIFLTKWKILLFYFVLSRTFFIHYTKIMGCGHFFFFLKTCNLLKKYTMHTQWCV